MKHTLLILIFLISYSVFSQEHAWVYLNDKPNSAAALANPISILTQKALDRKAAHNVVVDYDDVPVDEGFITQIKAQTGITVVAKSKWLNVVHVLGTETDINALTALTFVDHIEFADDNLNARSSQNQNKFDIENSQTVFNYGSAANQIEMFNGDDLHLADFTGTGMTVAVLDAGFPNVQTMSGFNRLNTNNGILGSGFSLKEME